MEKLEKKDLITCTYEIHQNNHHIVEVLSDLNTTDQSTLVVILFNDFNIQERMDGRIDNDRTSQSLVGSLSEEISMNILSNDIFEHDMIVSSKYVTIYEIYSKFQQDVVDISTSTNVTSIFKKHHKRKRRSHENSRKSTAILILIQNDILMESNPPNLPIFKKQVMTPIREMMRNSKTQKIILFDSSISRFKAKFIILVDILMKEFEYLSIDVTVTDVNETSTCLSNISYPGVPGDESYHGEITRLVDSFDWKLSEEYLTFVHRLIYAIYRDYRYSSTHTPKLSLQSSITSSTTSPFTADDKNHVNKDKIDTNQSESCLKPWPSSEEGLNVIEFFSGIGGMRLALPKSVRGVDIKSIVAYDCSDIVNSVYDLNFHSTISSSSTFSILNPSDNWRRLELRGELKRLLIDGIKVEDIDGKADIWTMSPPCQPYTTTKGSLQLDEKDNRSRPLFHLMHLLLAMRQRPRMIFLENVQGFVGSSVLMSWKEVLIRCGYKWKQYLLSPISSVDIPNNRLRYYMMIEHSSSIGSSLWDDVDKDRLYREVKPLESCTSIQPIGNFIMNSLSSIRKNELLISRDILSQSWASSRLSIVGSYDKTSYCFTKSYGKIHDKSSGSLYLEGAEGPLADKSNQVDRMKLEDLYGRIRLFDPDEVLAISGFPSGFQWPDDIPLKRRWACVGNSINVTVVKELMNEFFNGVASFDE